MQKNQRFIDRVAVLRTTLYVTLMSFYFRGKYVTDSKLNYRKYKINNTCIYHIYCRKASREVLTPMGGNLCFGKAAKSGYAFFERARISNKWAPVTNKRPVLITNGPRV